MHSVRILTVMLCCACSSVFGQAIPLDCAAEIVGGQVITFEQVAGNVNEALEDFDMTATPNATITELVSWVTGNGWTSTGVVA